MKKADVKIGETYRTEIEPGITILVRIVSEDWAGKGWDAVALNTGETVRVPLAKWLRKARAPLGEGGDECILYSE